MPTLHTFALRKWSDRAKERGEPEPSDLSSSCKFMALLLQQLFGGEIRGNWHHVHVRLPDGAIVDLNSDAQDVRNLRLTGIDPYRHDRSFIRSREFRESLASCTRRVEEWVDEWRQMTFDDKHVDASVLATSVE